MGLWYKDRGLTLFAWRMEIYSISTPNLSIHMYVHGCMLPPLVLYKLYPPLRLALLQYINIQTQ